MSTNIVAHFNPDGIPEYLKQRPQWIVWGKRTKQSQNALLKNSKLDQTSFNPRTGEVALSDEPKTWGTFEDAILAYQNAWYLGIGFMFAEDDGLVGITLNHCFIIGTKILLPEAQLILERFGETFAEIFPSGNRRGDGLHIYCFGLASRCGKGEHARWIELCGKDITGHHTHGYFCVTGHQFSKTREITDCQASLYWLHQTFKACATHVITSLVPAPPISNEISSHLVNKDAFKTRDNNSSKVPPASEDSRTEQPFQSASALNELCEPSEAQLTIASAEPETGTRAELENVVKPIATPATDTVSAAAVVSPEEEFSQRTFAFTDLGNAERFVHLYGDQVRYCQQNKSWYIWDGRRWERDRKLQVMELVYKTVRSILDDAVDTRLSKEPAKLAIKHHAKLSENTTRMKAMLEHARPKVSIAQEELDAHPMLLNVKNGVVDLKTGQLLPHNPKLLLSKIANTAFVKTASCSRWLAFVNWCFKGDQELINFVQKGIGYSIAGEIREQNFFVLYGDSDNGKSTFINVIRLLLGDYGYAAPYTLVIRQRHEGHPTELAALKGRRIVAVSETHKNTPLNIRRMKDMTNRTMTARFMGGNFFEFPQSHTIWIDTNHRPVINDPDDAGIWKRVKPIPFLNKITNRDIDLEEKLLAEAPGILSWLVEGCVAYQREGLSEPPI
jgi:putative DNA primase/helicase